MRRALAIVITLLLAVTAARPASAAPPLVAAYWGPYSIYDDAYLPKDLPADMLQVLYVDVAFPTAKGTCSADPYVERTKRFTAAESINGRADDRNQRTLGGVIHQLQMLRRAHPKLKVLLTIGELDPAPRFAHAARSAASRQRFVASCINRYIRGHYPGITRAAPGVFDGIDLDWEIPHGTAARHSFTLLAREFRRQLNTVDRHLLLTAAIGVDPSLTRNFELGPAARSLNWINLMGYELAGVWSDVTAFHSPLFLSPNVPAGSTTLAGGVSMFVRHGVPKSKLVLGLPFYGKAYANVAQAGPLDGLRQPFSGMLAGAPDGGLNYRDILTRYPTATIHHDTRAAQAWLYDAASHTTVVFDDPDAVRRKMALVRQLGLRGAMMWEITQDTDTHDLLGAMVAGRQG